MTDEGDERDEPGGDGTPPAADESTGDAADDATPATADADSTDRAASDASIDDPGPADAPGDDPTATPSTADDPATSPSTADDPATSPSTADDPATSPSTADDLGPDASGDADPVPDRSSPDGGADSDRDQPTESGPAEGVARQSRSRQSDSAQSDTSSSDAVQSGPARSDSGQAEPAQSAPAGTDTSQSDGTQPAHSPGVPEDVRTYDRFQKIDGSTYDRANDFLRERTYITAREWAIARLCADFRTETGVEMTKIGEHLPELVPFMTDTYSPQAVNQARAAFEEKVRKAGATFLYGAMSDFFTAEELDDVMYEATEVAKFLLEVEGVDLTVEEELEAEDTISEVMREVREHSAALRHGEVSCPECGHQIRTEDA